MSDTPTNVSSKPEKIWPPNKGWEKIAKMNQARDEAAKKRAMKALAYRAMVGSGREFKKKKQELRELGYL